MAKVEHEVGMGETIVIGDGITIEVVKIGRGKARIAVVAPADIRVVRGEILKRDNKGNDREHTHRT